MGAEFDEEDVEGAKLWGRCKVWRWCSWDIELKRAGCGMASLTRVRLRVRRAWHLERAASELILVGVVGL